MDLKIKDVAELLRVSETTVRRWLSSGKIPAYRLNHQYRFSRTEIEDWMMAKSSKEEPFFDNNHAKESGMQAFGLYRALHKGDVFVDVPGDTKEELIKKAVSLIAKSLHVDGEILTELLMDREKMMPTALNHGFAVPHTRDFLLPGPFDRVIVVYPKKPIEYGALDQEKVHTLFFLLACEDKSHLRLLAKLAHLASGHGNRLFLEKKPEKKALLAYIKDWESGVCQPALNA